MHTERTQRRHAPARNRRLTAAALALALLLALTGAAAPQALAAAAPQTVRAGFFPNGDFMHKADGAYSGYDVEYDYTLAGYADWDLRFVEYDSLNAALAALERGEIDVMSGLSVTAERAAKYLVSEQKMCTARIAVQTRADDDRFSAGDIAGMAALTCGILRGSNVVALYGSWCADNGLTPHIVEYDSLDARNAALESGAVDAIAGGSTIPGAQKIAEFPSLDLYYMFNRDRADLKTALDRAMERLALAAPAYADDLFRKYFPTTRNTVPSFGAAEKAFLAAHPVLRVAVLGNDAPFSAAKRDGGAQGVLPDYLAHLAKMMGAAAEFVPFSSSDDACAALSAGRVDLVGRFENNIFDANGRGVLLTAPYLKMNLVQITRAGTDAVQSAAVPACNLRYVTDALAAARTELTVTARVNGKTCFDALKAGRVDSVICTQPAAAWLLNRNRASDYLVLAFGGGTYDVSCAVARGTDGNTLRAILNKCIAVDGGYLSKLITSETLEDSADLTGFVYRLPVTALAVIAAAAALLLVIAVAALIVLIRRRRSERRLAAQRAELTAAAEANKARHAFFGAVSHDMRTPLNGIIGFADLALASGDPARMRDCLTKIRDSGAILSSLVNDTLIMSRLENGKYTLNPAPCDTGELFGGVIEPIRALADKKGVRFEDNIASLRRRTVRTDGLSLQKILLNLLTNAVKFTPPGGRVSLDCHLEPADGAQPETVLIVSDTGAGISREFLPHIFEPFAQEHADNADTAGSGMGLSIVRSIVTAMGGTVTVQSAPGQGTAFTVRLRLEEVAPPAEKAPPEDSRTGRLRGRRVLVCEDNALNLEIVRSILSGYGMEVVGAENGRRGVELFAASPVGSFDAVLLDLRMPVMDGRSAARAIRALDRSDAAAVPIFAVSADAFPENVAECLAAGMNGHIAKPIHADELAETLADALRDR